MPRPSDDNITLLKDDFRGLDSGSPIDTTEIGTFLDDELRNIKSIVREESVNKSWERWLGLIPDFTFDTGTTFTSAGDWTAVPATVGRRVRATISTGYIYGRITAASYAAPDTTVTVVWDSGALDATLSEVAFGFETTSLIGANNHGRVTMVDNETEVSVVVNESNDQYDVQLTIMRSSGAPLTMFGVKPGTLTASEFIIEALTSPGVGESFTFFWSVDR